MEISKAEHLKRQKKSGLSMREYAEGVGIPPVRFYSWAKEARKKAATSESTFVQISGEPVSSVEVTLRNGIVVRVSADIDGGKLQQLVEALHVCAE